MKEWLYGRNPTYETLRAGRRHIHQCWLAKGVKEKGRLAEIIGLCRQRQIPIHYVPRPELGRINPVNQGIALQAGPYAYHNLSDILSLAEQRAQSPFLLLLDTLQDPQNLGTLLRTAEAVGVHGVVIPHAHTATVTPAVVASSSGASEHLLIAQANLAQTIQALQQENIWVIGLDGGDVSQPAAQVNLTGALALVVGSEGQGMRRLVREKCDILMRLPMHGQVDSLNAAVAGSISLYLALSAREEA